MVSFSPVVCLVSLSADNILSHISFLCHSDASQATVNRVLSTGQGISIAPGGIAEIFEGYPKAGYQPHEECAVVRKGFIRMAIQHGIPVFPIYCFGSSKMYRRLNIEWLEKLSRWMRISICIFYGLGGLPIPFRQKLRYVIGDAIEIPDGVSGLEDQVNVMHQRFCDELMRLFDRHKEAYGWGHKALRILTH